MNGMGRIPGLQFSLLQQWMQFYLIEYRCHAGFVDNALQMADIKITDTDTAGQSGFL